METDIVTLVQNVAFPVFVAVFLLTALPKKFDAVKDEMVKMNIKLALLLHDRGIKVEGEEERWRGS